VVAAHLEKEFPGLRETPYSLTSPRSDEYNCIAWAASDDRAWWWPDPMGVSYWPIGVPRVATLQAFEQAYAQLGFQRCSTPNVEPLFEKIAVFADAGGMPQHAARQLPDGTWSSKLGVLEDINHTTLESVSGASYGHPVLFMRRHRKSARQ
jgi:hypothetical protein